MGKFWFYCRIKIRLLQNFAPLCNSCPWRRHSSPYACYATASSTSDRRPVAVALERGRYIGTTNVSFDRYIRIAALQSGRPIDFNRKPRCSFPSRKQATTHRRPIVTNVVQARTINVRAVLIRPSLQSCLRIVFIFPFKFSHLCAAHSYVCRKNVSNVWLQKNKKISPLLKVHYSLKANTIRHRCCDNNNFYHRCCYM
jgi:hypothetical protein